MDNGARILGAIAAFAIWQFVIWPLIGKAWRAFREHEDAPTIGGFMGRGTGRIYESRSVDPKLGNLASEAISLNRYTVRSHHGDKAILILKTDRRHVVTIERMASLSGGAPDMILQAVYDPAPATAEAFADDLAEMVYD